VHGRHSNSSLCASTAFGKVFECLSLTCDICQGLLQAAFNFASAATAISGTGNLSAPAGHHDYDQRPYEFGNQGKDGYVRVQFEVRGSSGHKENPALTSNWPSAYSRIFGVNLITDHATRPWLGVGGRRGGGVGSGWAEETLGFGVCRRLSSCRSHREILNPRRSRNRNPRKFTARARPPIIERPKYCSPASLARACTVFHTFP